MINNNVGNVSDEEWRASTPPEEIAISTGRSPNGNNYIGGVPPVGVVSEYIYEREDEEDDEKHPVAESSSSSPVAAGSPYKTKEPKSKLQKLRVGFGKSVGSLFRSTKPAELNNQNPTYKHKPDQMTMTDTGEIEISSPTKTRTLEDIDEEDIFDGLDDDGGQDHKKMLKAKSQVRFHHQDEEDEDEQFSEMTPGDHFLPRDAPPEARERSYETKERRLVRRRLETIIILILLILCAFTMIYLGMRHHNNKKDGDV